MATGVRALGSDREPQEWVRATAQAREVRAVVAGQVADLLVASATDAGGTGGLELTGGWELYALRVRELGEARRTGDPMLIREALMNATVAGAQLVVRMDLRQDFPV